MKKIPYGIIDYEKIIEKDYYYIDKTMYLEKLENAGDILMYLRPGRFGKSLFTSMMYYYYDINSKDKFDTLFKDTYVYNNPTINKNNYYVLNLDFSGIDINNKSYDDIEEIFKSSVIIGIEKFLAYYNFEYKADYTKTSAEIIKFFLNYLDKLSLKNKVYIIVDEYDNFTNAILEGKGEKFKEVAGKFGFVKNFYTVIKTYVKYGVVDRVFITGICPITMDAMTTGLNIATDISNHLFFTSMIGLTHDEVRALISEIDKDKQEEIFNLMVENYDGYLFNHTINSPVDCL